MTLLDIRNTTSLLKQSEKDFAPPQPKGRTLTPLEAAIQDAARPFVADHYVLIWHQDCEGRYTGFQPIPKPEDEEPS